MYYISEKAQDRLLQSIPSAYHADSSCRLLHRHKGTKAVRLSDSDRAAFGSLLTPCKGCATVQGKQTITEVLVKNNGPTTAATTYPYPQTVTLWTCSDGEELTDEKEALRHELGILRQRVLRSAV